MNETPPKSRRRWLQFSLKTMFVVMIFAAGYSAGIGTFIRRAQRLQQEAISAEQAARKAAEQSRMQAERERLRAEIALNSLEKAKADQESPIQTPLTEDFRAGRPD
jgi:cell division protein FtsB